MVIPDFVSTNQVTHCVISEVETIFEFFYIKEFQLSKVSRMRKQPARHNFNCQMSSTGSFVNVSMIPNYYRNFKTGSGFYEHPVVQH